MRPFAPNRFHPSAQVTVAGSISGGHQVSWMVGICRSVQPPGAGAGVAVWTATMLPAFASDLVRMSVPSAGIYVGIALPSAVWASAVVA